MSANEPTKPCPVCGKHMVEVRSDRVGLSDPPTLFFDWTCYGCGHEETSRAVHEPYFIRDTGRERWKQANSESKETK